MDTGMNEARGPVDFNRLWLAVGRMALAGEISLRDARWACSQLMVAAALGRHWGNKTRAAAELGTSRRVVRTWVERWEEGGDGCGLLEELRRRGTARREAAVRQAEASSDGVGT